MNDVTQLSDVQIYKTLNESLKTAHLLKTSQLEALQNALNNGEDYSEILCEANRLADVERHIEERLCQKPEQDWIRIRTEPEWIECSKRTPVRGQAVYVAVRNHKIGVFYPCFGWCDTGTLVWHITGFEEHFRLLLDYEEVTHWMPFEFPKPPVLSK